MPPARLRAELGRIFPDGEQSLADSLDASLDRIGDKLLADIEAGYAGVRSGYKGRAKKIPGGSLAIRSLTIEDSSTGSYFFEKGRKPGEPITREVTYTTKTGKTVTRLAHLYTGMPSQDAISPWGEAHGFTNMYLLALAIARGRDKAGNPTRPPRMMFENAFVNNREFIRAEMEVGLAFSISEIQK